MRNHFRFMLRTLPRSERAVRGAAGQDADQSEGKEGGGGSASRGALWVGPLIEPPPSEPLQEGEVQQVHLLPCGAASLNTSHKERPPVQSQQVANAVILHTRVDLLGTMWLPLCKHVKGWHSWRGWRSLAWREPPRGVQGVPPLLSYPYAVE